MAEILNHKDLHHFLLIHLPEGHGLQLGTMDFWGDIMVQVPYGQTVSFEELLRRTYSFEFYSVGELPYGKTLLLQQFPARVRDDVVSALEHYQNIPRPEYLAREVNSVLLNGWESNFIQLP